MAPVVVPAQRLTHLHHRYHAQPQNQQLQWQHTLLTVSYQPVLRGLAVALAVLSILALLHGAVRQEEAGQLTAHKAELEVVLYGTLRVYYPLVT